MVKNNNCSQPQVIVTQKSIRQTFSYLCMLQGYTIVSSPTASEESSFMVEQAHNNNKHKYFVIIYKMLGENWGK